MEKLLQWAVNNSDQSSLSAQADAIRRGEALPDPSRYDPKIIEAILGKDDATRMKEAVECISNPEDTVENKQIALDNLELLIEGIDNACNIENMKLWPAIIAQLTADAPEVRKGTAWVCGTAVQNNTQAQKAFMKHGGLEPLLKLLSEDTDSQVRNKALYAISGFIKHNDEGRQAFEQQGGYKVMRAIMKGEDVNMLRKVVFLYNSLMFDDPALPKKLAEDGTLDEFKRVMAEYSEDEDMVEKAQCAIDTLNDNIKA